MEFNSELARRALDLITFNPDAHVQDAWRCSTGMCFAGWTAVASELEWVSNVEHSEYYEWVYVAPELWDRSEQLAGGILWFSRWESEDNRTVNGRTVMHVSDAAAALLGLDSQQRGALFSSANNRSDIEMFVKAIESNPPGEERKREIEAARDIQFQRRAATNRGRFND